ncbi:XapX domain-containing protein [Sphingomonas sp. PsM26]|nr:XapX domain-containing protein [Sphingomonas sp. PsM26]
MRPYLISLAAGVLVGVIYALIKVRSPAPPTIALVGLAGILIGEQAVPLVKSLWSSKEKAAEIHAACNNHVFGKLPANTDTDAAA